MTLYQLAQRHLGIAERAGRAHHPAIQWWMSFCRYGLDAADEVPWCSGFLNYLAWLADLPRSNSAAARSWLVVGAEIALEDARVGNDVVILTRGNGPQLGPDRLDAPGHVGLFAGLTHDRVLILGGNQSNAVTLQGFHASRVLGVRRLA